jgi:predicted nucleic acid-binding protein
MKIFLDTNILFGLIYRLKNTQPIDYFENLKSKHQLFVSTFVLAEIYTLQEKL